MITSTSTSTRTRTRALSSLALLAMVELAACGGGDKLLQTTMTATPVTARVAPVERLSEQSTIEVHGIVQPARQAMVSSRVMGPVVSVHVDAGDTVRSGQVLLEIQPEASAGQLAQARGALAQATAAHALAERNMQRYQALHAEDAASEVELDLARMQLEQARGAVEQAEGAVRAASSVAAEATVRAPFAARVVERLAEVGDMAAPGRPLVRLQSLTGREIWLAVRAADIFRLEQGQSIGVRLDTRSDLGTIAGTVNEIVPFADPATHTFTVRVSLADADESGEPFREPVLSGLSGRAAIPGETTDRLLVPGSAVHRRGGLELVVVLAADGTARTRAVTVGTQLDDGRVEILSGLGEGEQVLTDTPGPLADGTPVEVAS